ncbi:hypothetical protein KJ359_009397 [Pestalotiopsis sp. 9143b]|nr:hypothetical protein KJ359_009397 [Pestalotiopsis sp. 9143b]
MAHIPRGAGMAPAEDDVREERPTNRRLEHVNAYPGTHYTQLLLDTLAPFQVPDVNGAARGVGGHAFDQTYINETPTIEHVCNVMLPIARSQVGIWQDSAPQPGQKLSQTLDVSWTKPAPVMPYRCDAPTTDVTAEAIWAIKESLKRIDPPYEFRILEMGPVVVAKPFGVTETTVAAGTPTFAKRTWDDRFLRIEAAPIIFEHEGYRWNMDANHGAIPSDDDAGSDHGGPMDHRIQMDDPSHRLLRRVNKRLRELQDEIKAYSRKRKNIREVFRGRELGDLEDVPAVELPGEDEYLVDEVADWYYPDTDGAEWVGHENPNF